MIAMGVVLFLGLIFLFLLAMSLAAIVIGILLLVSCRKEKGPAKIITGIFSILLGLMLPTYFLLYALQP